MCKLLSFLLLAAFLVSMTSCAENSLQPSDTVSSPETPAPETNEAEELIYPDLNGFTLHVAKIDQSAVAWSNNTFVVDEMNSDILNNALFERNAVIEAKTGATIAETSFTDIKTLIRQNARANDTTYHLYMERIREIGSLTTENYFHEIHEVEGLQLDMPWWDQNFMEDTSVMGKNYMLVGDVLLTTADCLYSIIYDKAVAEEVKITDIYQTVRDGKWTLDKMQTYMEMATNDLNGDGIYDRYDRYGLITVPVADPIFAFIIASGETAFKLGEDGTPHLAAGGEKFSDILSRLQRMYSSQDYFCLNDYSGLKNSEAITALFTEQQALFLPQCISAGINYLRDITHDFGFLPTPKYDESQQNYLSHVNMAAPVFLVPLTNQQTEQTGALLEILCHYSNKHVMEVYYENCFAGKSARDEESYEMLKLALENKVYDLGFVWKWGDFMNKIASLVANNSTSVSSTIASMENAINAEIEKTLYKLQD